MSTLCARDYKDPKLVIEQPKCIQVDLQQTVKVRKYEVDVEKLKATLREYKNSLDWSINSIANYLKRPKTEVEHWFRNDNCFSIPDPDIWLELKDLLDIETDEFDKPIMEFETKPNEFDMANRAYHENGLFPTIPTSCGGNHEPKIAEPLKIKEATAKGYAEAYDGDSVNISFPNSDTRRGRVGGQIAQTLDCGCQQGVVVAEPIIYDDYNNRIKTDQSAIGTLTTNCGNDAARNGVKIIELKLVGGIGEKKSNGGTQCYQQDRVYDSREIAMCHPANLPTGSYNYLVVNNYRFYQQAYETLQENECEYGDTIDAFNKRVNKDGVTPTITTRPEGLKTAILPITQNYRIRKLTPKECWRLMGVKDEDFEKVAKNQSNSSLYHLAGDSIITNVLMAIFKNILGGPIWNIIAH